MGILCPICSILICTPWSKTRPVCTAVSRKWETLSVYHVNCPHDFFLWPQYGSVFDGTLLFLHFYLKVPHTWMLSLTVLSAFAIDETSWCKIIIMVLNQVSHSYGRSFSRGFWSHLHIISSGLPSPEYERCELCIHTAGHKFHQYLK